MDNSGAGSLLVPGFNGIPIDKELHISQRFAHGFEEWKQVPEITLREFTITHVINKITDKPNWHKEVFDPEVVWRWYNLLILSSPLLSERTWDWCVAELKDKAKQYELDGFIRVLDTGSCVCKSDRAALQELSAELQAGMEPFHRDTGLETSTEGLHAYVDPSRYPLVYGKTRVLTQGGHVSRDGSISSGQNIVLEKATAPQNKHVNVDEVQERIEAGRKSYESRSHVFGDIGWQNIQKYYWSYKYQQLPSDVTFTGASGTEVHLTSYINGICPENEKLYNSLEKLISAFIEPWNECLIKGQNGWKDGMVEVSGGWAPTNNERHQRGRYPCRIITYGVEWENEAPEWFKIFDTVRRRKVKRYQDALAAIEDIKKQKPPKEADRKTKIKYKLGLFQAEDYAASSRWNEVRGLEQLSEPTPELWQRASDYLVQTEPGSTQSTSLPENWQNNTHRLLRAKLKRMLYCTHPEPGTAFTYEEWKSGLHSGKSIINMITPHPIIPSKTPPTTPHRPYTISLQTTFREKGLQVILHISGIELTPSSPSYPGSPWTLQGQKNEHIVAVGIYVYSAHNVTESKLSFRQETHIAPRYFRCGPYLHQPPGAYYSAFKNPACDEGKGSQIEAISEIFGFKPEQMYSDLRDFTLPVQNIGGVTLPQGRMVAFPNAMEARREPFGLVDPEMKGHHRWVTVMLVDPSYRICSTGNVPLGKAGWGGGGDEAGEEGAWGDGDRDKNRVTREMGEERGRMHWARYAMMGSFFFD